MDNRYPAGKEDRGISRDDLGREGINSSVKKGGGFWERFLCELGTGGRPPDRNIS